MSPYAVLHENPHDELIPAMKAVVEVITSTYGPKGSNVLLNNMSELRSYKDGIGVARWLRFKDVYKGIAAKLVIDAMDETLTKVGDGTTSTAALVYELYKYCYENNVSTDEMLDMEAKCLEAIKQLGRKCEEKELLNVAMVSSNYNEGISKNVVSIVKEVGPGGILVAKPTGRSEDWVESRKGYRLNYGPASERMLTGGKSGTVLKDPLVFFCGELIDKAEDYARILQLKIKGFEDGNTEMRKEGMVYKRKPRPLVIFCHDMIGDALQTAVGNFGLHNVYVVVHHAKMLSKTIYEDMMVYTGTSNWIDPTSGISMEMMEEKGHELFGEAEEITFWGDRTVIKGKEKYEGAVAAQVEKVEALVGKTDQETQFYKDRIVKLTSGYGTYYYRANSRLETSDVKEIIDDCQRACFSALKDGVVPGGLTSYMVSPLPEAVKTAMADRLGVQGDWERKSGTDLRTGVHVNYDTSGIIEPVKVPLSVVETSFSVVRQLLKTKFMVNYLNGDEFEYRDKKN